MTPTEMDQLTTPTGPATLEPAEPYSPPAPPVRASRPSAWVPMFQSRERRWWTAALSAALLITALGIGVIYVDDTNNQSTIRSLTTQNEPLTGRNQILNDRLKTTQANLTATLGELAKTKADLEHHHLRTCKIPQRLKAPSWNPPGAVPGTLPVHRTATPTAPTSGTNPP